MRTTILALLGLSLATAAAAASNASASDPATGARFAPRACAPELADAKAVCGSVSVPESDAEPNGRRIELNVVVFPALEPAKEKAAQFDLEGGPGFAVTESAAFYASDGVEYRRHRDVVLVDLRGTGGSNPLRCTALEERMRAEPATLLYPPELVADCARELAAKADLTHYTTAAAARDLDAVRETLGYERVDLNAVSYGTTLALRYLADFEPRVRTALLVSTVPAERAPPRFHAAAAEQGLRRLFAACAADPDCAKRYPDPAADLARAVEPLGASTRARFLEKVRTMLYLPPTARRVPSILRKAAGGDLSILAGPGGMARPFADGLYLAITCAESLARFDLGAAIAEAALTPFGAYRLERQRDACARWPTAPADPKLFDPPRSAVPVLFVSGALDPVSPPEWTSELLPRFPNGRQIVLPNGAHALEGLSGLDSCFDRISLDFVARGSAAGIDTSCVAEMSAGPFL